jgi:hypothetical protein
MAVQVRNRRDQPCLEVERTRKIGGQGDRQRDKRAAAGRKPVMPAIRVWAAMTAFTASSTVARFAACSAASSLAPEKPGMPSTALP